MIITSKFPGICAECRTPYHVGERISWSRSTRAMHARCSAEGREIQAKVEASRAPDADIDIPAPDGRTYLPYQRAGIAYALARKGVLIADEMGLGKTIQAIGVVNGDPTIERVLVICPASLKINWEREFRRWLARPLPFGVVSGKHVPDTDGLIVNYDLLTRHLEALCAIPWDLVIVDEAHYGKNEKAARTKAMRAIARTAKRAIALTGTPILNKPIELFPILSMVDPGNWDPAGTIQGKAVAEGHGAGFFRFAKRYCDAKQEWVSRSKQVWNFDGKSNLEELQEKLRATCMVRRVKKDVLPELPAKRRQLIELPADGSEKALRDEQRAWDAWDDRLVDLRARVALAEAQDDATGYREAVASLQKSSRVAFTEMAGVRHATAVAKAPLVVQHLRDALESSEKIVVFAHHRDMVSEILNGLDGFECVSITGETSQIDRQNAVDRFQTDANVRVFVGSITAAGVGLTLTAAAHVIFAELSWVPAEVTQAEDRCHRIGQHDSVLIQHLVLAGSLDAAMARTIVAKQDVADAALDDVPAFPDEAPEAREKREERERAASTMTPAAIALVHTKLRFLAARCDGAATEDGAGFNKLDTYIGKSLAAAATLTPKQAALGQKIVVKYKRQLEGAVSA